MTRAPKPGVRYFKCESCSKEWIDVSRDVSSPSGDSCWCGAWVSPVEATTSQFDTLKHKLTPLGISPVGLPSDEVAKLNTQILQLQAEMEGMNRDVLYCPHCACQSCWDEKRKREDEDRW